MPRSVCVVVFLVPLLGCTTQATPDARFAPPTDDTAAPELSWYRDAAPIVAARCAGCHNAGGIAPFPLTTHDEVVALAQPIAAAVASGSMPPWQGADGCNEYSNDFSLTEDEQAMLLSWIDAGAPEGNPEDAVSAPARSPLDVDVVVTLPEPYTPVQQPDDYRCQLIEWPAEARRWITGMEVLPDQRSVVHHAIAFAVGAADAEAFREMDAAEDGPGYTCFGGPTSGEGRGLADMDAATLLAAIESGELAAGLGSTRWLGAWVPGVQATALPAGTGLRMDPGDLIVLQLHYNTLSSEPVPDQSSVGFQTADRVDREAMVLPFTDPGWVTGLDALGGAMDIPAGDSDTRHTTSTAFDGPFLGQARGRLGLAEDAPLVVHQVGHHMHLLGVEGQQQVRHADGETTCLADIPAWDFAWQSGFSLVEPVTLREGDRLELSCRWDNSAANQPVVGGVRQTPKDVAWGEGSTDEMCLSVLYLTGE